MELVEEFISIQGEGPHMGKVTYFVRLYGCNLKCNYCDTSYGHFGFDFYEDTVDNIADRIWASKVDYVCITGGEPLLQAEEVIALCNKLLISTHFRISIETNGEVHIPTELFWYKKCVILTMDIKTPGSGNKGVEGWVENARRLRDCDSVKFVVAKLTDMKFVKTCLSRVVFYPGCVYISPVFGKKVLAKQTAAMFINDLDFRHCVFQVQMHKVIWPPRMRGV